MLTTLRPEKLDKSDRKYLNEALHDINRKYYEAVPLNTMRGLFRSIGLDFEEAILCGETGNARFHLYRDQTEIQNSVLVLLWYRTESGRYEVTSYVS